MDVSAPVDFPVAWDDGSKTIGDWPTEQESADALDARLAACGLWKVHREVSGTLLQPRPGQVDKGVRIDRILVAGHVLIESGWRHGVIGVEVKRSDVRIGPPLAQAMDYTRSAWPLGASRSQVILDMVFIWPMPKQHGPMASVMAQNRVGTATPDGWSQITLRLGEETVIRVKHDGTFHLGSGSSGRKVGSR